ncbi:GFA family protein [Erythrobacter litoralis]|uniref:GFA family protein n=1 Tax=Erythrobacter litoralis TaxID=39960 RepID=UPI0024407AFD|nr:GFA family protein [Erythrobacter litoralis]
MSAAPLEARCLCGATRYRLRPPYDGVVICHCRQCRHANGSYFQPVVPVQETQVEWLAKDALSEHESSPDKFRAFCSRCGAPVYSRRNYRPGQLRLRAGLIDEFPMPASIEQQFEENALVWLKPLTECLANLNEETA